MSDNPVDLIAVVETELWVFVLGTLNNGRPFLGVQTQLRYNIFRHK